MQIKRSGERYTVYSDTCGLHYVVRIISEHESQDDAVEAMIKLVIEEGGKAVQKEVDELRAQGIRAATVKEAIKDMTPEERNRKFVNPLLDLNFKMLEEKRKQLRKKWNE